MEALADRTGSSPSSGLPTLVLASSGIATLIAVVVGAMSIHLHLKNYRKPRLQRMVVRIMVMVPLYAMSSLIALFSMEAAFVIDVIRDIYEAFVIYCFFSLLLSYLGGERSLLILLHGRPPKAPLFPFNLFQREIDPSDPHTFLFLKRGILQYVQVKPVLAIATLILKACGLYKEGNFSANSGYLYISVVYNASIFLSLYCLATFWLCVNEDLKHFRPIPKFLCVKGILFFSFWQSFAISILVASHVITKLGPYEESEYISLGLTDTLICLEMPFFAIAHLYAFSFQDFIDPKLSFVARMPMYYAFWDAFGSKDVVEDSKATLKGKGMDYREFEPAEGYIHQGVARSRRIRAGLRYSKGGKKKYWLPKIGQDTDTSVLERAVGQLAPGGSDDAHAPLLADESEHVVHMAPDLTEQGQSSSWDDPAVEGFELPFGDLDETDEELFDDSRRYLFGDYNYPCIDVSSEAARVAMWDEEERVLRDERGAWFSSIRGAKGRVAMEQREGPAWEGYGAVGTHPRHYNAEVTGKWRGQRGKDGGNDKRGPNAEVVIDFEHDRTPAEDASDVRLKWTRMNPGHQSSRSSPAAVSPSHSHDSRHPPVQRSRPVSREPPIASTSRPSSVRGDNAGVRRDNKRVGATPVIEVETVRDSMEGKGRSSDERGRRREDTLPAEGDGVIARTASPPAHIRDILDSFEVPGSNNENPWA